MLVQGECLPQEIAPKRRSAATAAAFNDDLSIIEPSTFAWGPSKKSNRAPDVAV